MDVIKEFKIRVQILGDFPIW
uniref:Uncharacterized protein n=1 Tax=Rhizophora mucronata TaxID=61149 RepID=A0A2P2PFQ8_RHIMU